MSIAYEINRLQTSKADTKEQVNIDKDYINAGIDFIGSETVNNYDEKIQEMQEAYKAFIPVNTTSDTQIDAPKGGIIIGKALKGNTSQSGTPTPSAPVAVENATGLQKIKVTKKNLFDVSTLVNKSYNGASSSTRVCNSQAIYLAPGTYTFSTNINTSTYEFKTDVLKNPPTSPVTESYVYDSGFGTSNPRTITITSPGYFAILIKKNDDTGINDFTLKEFTYQLEKGSSATTYEEYQDTTLYMNRNKNLLKINDTSKTINGITFTENSDGSIHAEGTATDLAYYGTNTLLPILPSQRYRLSGCPEGGSLSSYYISITLKNESKLNIGSFSDIGDGVFGDFIAPDASRYMYAEILILSGTTINATFYPQLELGSEITSYKEYEPLQEGNYEINLGNIELNKIGNYQDFIKKGTGKNLFDKNNANILNGWLDNNKMALSPTQLNRLFYIPCKANTTYTISRSILTSEFRVATYDSESFPTIGSSEAQYDISGLIKDNSATSITITTGANAKYLIVHYGRLETDLNIEESLKTIQIEENSQATSFEPYGYKDQWYIEKNVGKIVLDGSESWTTRTASTGAQLYETSVSGFYSTQSITIGYSNQYIANISLINDNTFRILKGITLALHNDTIGSISNLKTFLSSNNLIVYYPLANTTYTLIENEELIEQLDEIMPLLEGQNNISVSGNLPTGIDVDYIERVNKHLIGNTNESAE